MTGVDTDVERQISRAMGARDGSILTTSRCISSAADSAASHIVFVGDRRAEQRQHRVARVLVDEAAVPIDDAAKGDEHRVDHLGQLVGLELLRQCGEPRDVGEERGDQPQLADPRLDDLRLPESLRAPQCPQEARSLRVDPPHPEQPQLTGREATEATLLGIARPVPPGGPGGTGAPEGDHMLVST